MDISLIKEAYKGKRVFLTGHTGFKGSWLLYWLNILGAEVKGYSLAPKNTNDLFYLIDGDMLCHSVINDIRHKDMLEKEVFDFQPDFVFHLAAQPLVRASYDSPSDTFEVNALGTAYVLDAVAKLDKQCSVILITTDKVYENKEWVFPYRETDRLGGYDPYSSSKACAELIISSYRNSFFNLSNISKHKKGIASTRAGNVIGGGDWSKDRIIPDIIKALSTNSDIQVRNPIAVRPWQHVLEPLGGYLLLGAKLAENPVKYSEAWNFGPYAEDNLTVEELVKIGINIWGKGNYNIPDLSNQPHEAGLLKLEISKATSSLHWHPQLNSSQAINMTINWYKHFINNSSEIKNYTKNEIVNYMNLIKKSEVQ